MSPPANRVQELIANNAKFVESYETPPTMPQIRATAEDPVLVLTCMDPRVVPEEFVGPKPLIAVFRNAGGRATPDVVRTINVFRSLTNKVQHGSVMVVHHTDCGMTHLTNEGIGEDAVSRSPEASEFVQATDFGCFTAEDLEKVILEDVETLKAASSLKGTDIRGYVLSTETGHLREL